ncbi:hypothetical protein QQY66_42090 [Streptomyces sp. DG2A-72]|uniref:hypothetical protein n=1 Tax=Streptomyces sp. DG2A-72 TaxID=3051386 RepID=UPI00265C39EB|nr:hypothetical protein [Streptomyces sp. DG2A-72]MDO0938001.1 hypothetical protein [Streptomyces sp. DG2A-72]
MSTEQPADVTEAEVVIDEGRLTVEDLDGGGSAVAARAAAGAPWLLAADNIVILVSASDALLHYPSVRVESWDHPAPRPPDGAWTDTGQTSLQLSGGTVAILPFSGGAVAGDPLPVGPPGRYAVRAHRTGGDTLDALLTDDPDAVPHGIERFLLQFWPLRQ